MSDVPTEVEEVEVPAVLEKKFSQDELNRIVQKEKKALEKKFDEERSRVEKELEAIRSQLPQPSPPDEKDYKGQLDVLRKEFGKAKEELTREVEKQRREAEQERAKRVEADRERVLMDALSAAGCNNYAAARKFFMPNILWDSDDQTWKFQADDASEQAISVKNGIMRDLPDFWKTATGSDKQGAGSPAGPPGSLSQQKASKQKEYEAGLAKLSQIYKVASTSGPTGIKKFNQAKRELEKLALELGHVKPGEAFNPKLL